jgi:hypothetical protein
MQNEWEENVGKEHFFKKGAGEAGGVAEHQASKLKALSSSPSTTKRKKKEFPNTLLSEK